MRRTMIPLLVVLSACALSMASHAEPTSQAIRDQSVAAAEGAVFEIRNYHYDPGQLDAYKAWAINHAIPFFKAHMDVVGFWMGNDHPPRVAGTTPMQLELGSANITWIIRWDSMEARTTFHREVFGAEEWRNIWAKHPDPAGYFQSEARFTTAY